MAEHTSGPWRLTAPSPGDNAWTIWAADNFPVTVLAILRQPAEANARLIAAAPELLSALIALTDYTAGEAMFQRGANGPWQIEDEQLGRLIEASRDAIAKAEGDQP